MLHVLLLCVLATVTSAISYPPASCSDTENQELIATNPYIERNNTDTSSTYVMKYYDVRNSFRHEVGELMNFNQNDSYMEIRGYLIWWTTFKKAGEEKHKVYTMYYLVDNKGFHVEGDHIPGTKGKIPNKLSIENVPCKEAPLSPEAPHFLRSIPPSA